MNFYFGGKWINENPAMRGWMDGSMDACMDGCMGGKKIISFLSSKIQIKNAMQHVCFLLSRALN